MRESMQKQAGPVQRRANAPATKTQHENALAESPRVVMQRKAMGDGFGGASAPVGGGSGSGGLPGNLMRGIAALSGMDLSDVKVHRDSAKPAQLKALAFAQNNEIHLGPGQEKHMPHEAWHIVQQRQGRVKTTLQEKGVGINDEPGLEKEATVMGERAMRMPAAQGTQPVHGGVAKDEGARARGTPATTVHAPIQRYTEGVDGTMFSNSNEIAIENQTQNLYATNAVINASNSKLSAIGSALRLEGVDRYQWDNTSGPKVKVVWKPAISRTKAINGNNQEFKNIDMARQNDPLLLWADCSKSSAEVSGSKSGNREDDLVVMNEYGNIGGAKPGQHMDGLTAKELDSSAAKFANAVYIELLDKFITLNKSANYMKLGYHFKLSPGAPRRTPLKIGTKNYSEHERIAAGFADDVPLKPGKRARCLYDKLGPAGRDAFDRYAGINRYAVPDVGETYSMATEYSMPNSHQVDNKARWVYHYAGVIMVDGSDRVTLENYSVSDDKAVNKAWHFAIYGTPTQNDPATDQTFHEKHLASNTHGNKATSLRIRTKK